VGAVSQELLQPLRRERNRIGPRDADGVEAMLPRGARQRRFERRWIAQKSRSA
jgi:hypothetical protein